MSRRAASGFAFLALVGCSADQWSDAAALTQIAETMRTREIALLSQPCSQEFNIEPLEVVDRRILPGTTTMEAIVNVRVTYTGSEHMIGVWEGMVAARGQPGIPMYSECYSTDRSVLQGLHAGAWSSGSPREGIGHFYFEEWQSGWRLIWRPNL